MGSQIRIFIDNKLIRFFLRNAGLTIIPACKCAAFIRFRDYRCSISGMVAGIANYRTTFFGINIDIDIVISIEMCRQVYIFFCHELICWRCADNIIALAPVCKRIAFIGVCSQNNRIALNIGTNAGNRSAFGAIFRFRAAFDNNTCILCHINVFACGNLLVAGFDRHCAGIVLKIIHQGKLILLLGLNANVIIVQAAFYIAIAVIFFKRAVHHAVICAGNFQGKISIRQSDNLFASAFFGNFNSIVIPDIIFTDKADLGSICIKNSHIYRAGKHCF